jgi:hypothetical protein
LWISGDTTKESEGSQYKHEGVKYFCNQSVDHLTKHTNLKAHQESQHEGVRYSCDQCEYEATRRGDTNNHIMYKIFLNPRKAKAFRAGIIILYYVTFHSYYCD